VGEVVNLRRARKARARAEAEAQAQANRSKHGRTKAEKTAREKTVSLEERRLAGLRRERPEDDGRQ
jgi:hypothetical protein